MLFQNQRTFVYPQNTNEDIFDEIWEISVLPLTASTFKAKKGSKSIIKVLDVIPVV